MAKGNDIYVCSKMAGDNVYPTWKKAKSANDLPRQDRQVLIKGGAGVINKQLVTPYGVVTKITADQLKLVRENCPSFNRHVAAGFLKVLEKDPTPDIETISKDMKDDKSKQKTKADLKQKKD